MDKGLRKKGREVERGEREGEKRVYIYLSSIVVIQLYGVWFSINRLHSVGQVGKWQRPQ